MRINIRPEDIAVNYMMIDFRVHASELIIFFPFSLTLDEVSKSQSATSEKLYRLRCLLNFEQFVFFLSSSLMKRRLCGRGGK